MSEMHCTAHASVKGVGKAIRGGGGGLFAELGDVIDFVGEISESRSGGGTEPELPPGQEAKEGPRQRNRHQKRHSCTRGRGIRVHLPPCEVGALGG